MKKIKDKKKFIAGLIKIGLGIILLVAFIFLGANGNKTEVKETDAVKFAIEYTTVNKDNVFVYKTAKEIITILKEGTGVVFLGFPECKWCQAYAPILNDVAKDVGLKTIYYYNIKDDRTNNTSDYQKIVELLKNNLQTDEEDKPRIYVPDVSFVKDGVMLGHDYETSLDTLDYTEPSEYWTTERVSALKTKLRSLMAEVNSNEVCDTCND